MQRRVVMLQARRWLNFRFNLSEKDKAALDQLVSSSGPKSCDLTAMGTGPAERKKKERVIQVWWFLEIVVRVPGVWRAAGAFVKHT